MWGDDERGACAAVKWPRTTLPREPSVRLHLPRWGACAFASGPPRPQSRDPPQGGCRRSARAARARACTRHPSPPPRPPPPPWSVSERVRERGEPGCGSALPSPPLSSPPLRRRGRWSCRFCCRFCDPGGWRGQARLPSLRLGLSRCLAGRGPSWGCPRRAPAG